MQNEVRTADSGGAGGTGYAAARAGSAALSGGDRQGEAGGSCSQVASEIKFAALPTRKK